MAIDNQLMESTTINESLQKVAKGTGLVFIGTIIGMILGFVQRVLIARHYTQAEYGVFSLATGILSIFAITSSLGLQEGVTRQIAYYKGKKEQKKVKDIIISSVEIALVASVIFSLILFFGSNFISTKLFHEESLILTLKILSISLPFFVLANIFTAIARGFNDIKPKVYFQDILRKFLFILLLIFIIWFNLSFLELMYAFSFSFIISCVLLAIYISKKFFISAKKEKNVSIFSVRKELLLFSLPLLITSIQNLIMTYTDTLMLGCFKTVDVVGLYNAALPVANFIPIVLTSMVFIYTPVASEFYSKNMLSMLKRNYAILTKWVFAATLPLFLIFFLFPCITLNLVFGIKYVKAGAVLQILALGFFIHTFLGPNGATLTSIGKTKLLMWASLLSAILNILLNIILIPTMGIIGAAIASASSLGLANIILSIKLYQISRIHPFTKNYIKSIVVSLLIVVTIYLLAYNILTVTSWMLPLLFILFLAIYTFALLFTKSFDKEDLEMLMVIEKKTGINLLPIRRIIKRIR